jgi:hypothetical protein
MPEYETTRRQSAGLVDLLDRVLDKGLIVAGDIKISLAEVELLTIRVRLLVCSVDKAMEIGLDWWKHDKHLSGSGQKLVQENEALRERVKLLEQRITEREPTRTGRRLTTGNGASGRARARRRAK